MDRQGFIDYNTRLSPENSRKARKFLFPSNNLAIPNNFANFAIVFLT